MSSAEISSSMLSVSGIQMHDYHLAECCILGHEY